MACPYFYPVEPAERAAANNRPPLPLGDTWSGLCMAKPDCRCSPDASTVQRLCNLGYAREKCANVPADGPDAVRFSISHDRDGLIGVYWVMEKNHLPFTHGPLEYSRADAAFRSVHPDACVARQAQAYVTSYLRRTESAGR